MLLFLRRECIYSVRMEFVLLKWQGIPTLVGFGFAQVGRDPPGLRLLGYTKRTWCLLDVKYYKSMRREELILAFPPWSHSYFCIQSDRTYSKREQPLVLSKKFTNEEQVTNIFFWAVLQNRMIVDDIVICWAQLILKKATFIDIPMTS